MTRRGRIAAGLVPERATRNETFPSVAVVSAMGRERKSARMQEQIKVLLDQGLSIRKVAESLNVARQTVRKYADGPKAPELSTSGEVAWDSAVDWEAVSKAVLNGTTVKQLHQEYCPEVSYTCFRRRLRVKAPRPVAVTLRLEHKPGERTQIDYCDGVAVTDRNTGEIRKTHLFCGVLPFSSYAFGEFVWNQKLPTFIASHERMWAFFGGVTPYVVVDNLKSGVKAAHRYDPDVNPTYCDYGNHQGFAVLPARPYTPRDKACVEATIGAIQRSFFQEVRQQTFYSLEALNQAFREFLVRFNEGLMKDYGQSRASRFEAEQALLLPLPKTLFEVFDWRSAKVHPDCHVQVDKNLYSVPFRFVGQAVRVRVTENLVEVFADGHSVAAHARSAGQGNVSTDEKHYPDAKHGLKSFHVQAAIGEAARVGPNTEQLVRRLLDSNRPLRYLRRVQGVLRLYQSKSVPQETAEYASKMALRHSQLRLSYVSACVDHHVANGTRLTAVAPPREQSELFLHGIRQGAES